MFAKISKLRLTILISVEVSKRSQYKSDPAIQYEDFRVKLCIRSKEREQQTNVLGLFDLPAILISCLRIQLRVIVEDHNDNDGDCNGSNCFGGVCTECDSFHVLSHSNSLSHADKSIARTVDRNETDRIRFLVQDNEKKAFLLIRFNKKFRTL